MMPPEPFYKTPEEMEAAAAEYFKTTDKPSISELALKLGFCDRHSLYDYEKKPAFTHTIKKIRATIVTVYEKATLGNAAAGPIFMLKNFGYSDKQEIDLSAKIQKMPQIEINGKPVTFDLEDNDGSTEPIQDAGPTEPTGADPSGS